MRLPRIAIENHQFTLVMALLLTLLGVFSFFTMPRMEDPKTDFAAAFVVAVYPGASPSDIEQLVAEPIEEAINELDDIHRLNTIINDGSTQVFVEFIAGSDPDEKFREVNDAVNRIQDDLPTELAFLETSQLTTDSVIILQVALASKTPDYRTLERLTERLEQRLERVAGVRQVDTWAYPDQEVEVGLDFEKMREIGLSLNQVIGAIQSTNAIIPGGKVDVGQRRFNLRTSDDYGSLEDLRRTVIHAVEGRIIYLKDVAEVDFAYADETHRGRFNGDPAVFLTVTQRPGSNIFTVRDALETELTAFASLLPETVQAHVAFDQAPGVARRVDGFFANLLQGLALVGLVVLLALGFRASAIVLLAIPISIFMGIGWLDMSGFGLQQISIVGLVISLGLLVDNAIVVTENVNRFLHEGASGKTAAIEGTNQIGWAVVSSTATTILSFLPLLMLPGNSGLFIRSMPVAVVYALIASLLISLTLTPYLSSRFLARKARRSAKATAPKPRWMDRLFRRIIQGPYRRTLGFCLRHPALTLTTATLVFVGSLALFPLVGVSLFPKAEKAQFLINIDTPEGTSLNQTDVLARYVEGVLTEREDVKQYTTNIGRSNPRMYYNSRIKSEVSTHAQILVEMHEISDPARTLLVRELRQTFGPIPGGRIEIKEFEQGPGSDAPIAIRVVGENLTVLKDWAAQVEAIIANTAGTVNINNPMSRSKTDFRVNINRDKAGILGVPLVEIDRTVRASMAGLPVGQFRDGNSKAYDIVVRLPVETEPTLADLDRLSVTALTGARIPLRQVATLALETTPATIEHHNLERIVSVTADVEDGFNVAAVTAEIIAQLDALDWPSDYRFDVGGQQEEQEESFGGIGQALMIALLGIFGVLVLQFRSFTQPIIVFIAIPFAITGAVLALLVTGYTFSFTAFVGLTSLVGIVVNNAIILVDYANQLRTEDQSVIAAISAAGETRFLPIVLTTLTTIGALLPLTLGGSSLWSPFGWAIIGGLLVSTLLTLLIVPVLYRVLTRTASV